MRAEKRKSVFISGSAHEYGRLGSSGKFFLRDLSRSLVNREFNIISGYGLGVGAHVVEGALEAVYADRKEKLVDQLQVIPVAAHNVSENLRNACRNDMISRADIALFLFGNKLDDISIKESDGLFKEFEIAQQREAKLIPVGASGYVSRKLWERVFSDYDRYFETREKMGLFEQIGDPSIDPETLIDLIIQTAS